MTAQQALAKPCAVPGDSGAADPLTSVALAREHVAAAALHDSPGGLVGLELEFHLVDLAEPARRPSWQEAERLAETVPTLPGGSSITLEPGGQLELSTPPQPGAVAAIEALRADRTVLRDALSQQGFGTAPLGSDPARPVRRVSPEERYAAMEAHFAAMGCSDAGRAMMCSTSALQVNLDAGPTAGWTQRLERIRRLGPVLAAVSACSPLLGGRASGWKSMRQQAWYGIDRRRSGPVLGADPAQGWADYALDAPVMLIRDGARIRPVTEQLSFSDWVRGGGPRRPTREDLDYHLTTLFPPVRPRGYVEIRYLDAVPDRWWPALAGLTVTLIDDDRAADTAAEACEALDEAWLRAACDGLADEQIHSAALACVDTAARRCPVELREDVAALADLVQSRRSPGDELRDRVDATDPATVLKEEARA